MQLPLLVFTDLDGTLLDHHSYSHAPARPALDRLAQIGAGVVLASSKTAAEIAPLRAALGLADWPAIAENGAGLVAPGQSGEGDDSAYRAIRAALASLPDGLRLPFRGFGDMDDAGVAEVTGLPVAQARLARQRLASEPGIWSGSDDRLADFLDALQNKGIAARRGGRFLTLSHGSSKSDRMAEIVTDLRPGVTIALGDAPNDIEMLEAADHGVIVGNPDAPPLPPLQGEETGRIRRTRESGPAGWNRAILDLLSELSLSQEPAADG